MIDKKDMDTLIKEGAIEVDNKGNIQLTKEGEKRALKVMEERPYAAKSILKKTLKQPDLKEDFNVDNFTERINRVDDTDLSIYERFDVRENDDLRNYQVFCKLIEIAQESRDKELAGVIVKIMRLCKYFEIPENINLLLSNTKNEVRENIKFPFCFNFLDVKTTIYDRNYYCFLIVDMGIFTQANKKVAEDKNVDLKELGKDIHIFSFYDCPDETIGWSKIRLHGKVMDKYNQKVREYVMNFVDFINSEEVKLMDYPKTEKNTERRLKRGRIPIPTYNKIYVVGYLAKYLEELEATESRTRFSHRFWVRGHFRHFWDKKKYSGIYRDFEEGKLRGTKKQYIMDLSGNLKVWIMPHIRGKGILVNRKYELK